MRLTDDQLAAYERDGFLRVERLIGDDAVAELRAAYDELLATSDDGRMLGGVTRQIMHPSARHPAFNRNDAVGAAREIASQVMDAPVNRLFDMLIFKPPGHAHETPWHQDASYVDVPFSPAGGRRRLSTLQFWVALDDADVENGCMHFVPGQHVEPLLEHEVASGDPTEDSRLLAIVGAPERLDLSSAVAAPVPAGGCTFHNERTPHYTSPNRSADRPRRAYIFNLVRTEGPAAIQRS
jgi:ectoine hydroxylase-related dioxygenase (phytanoyl-CoA dioxygenase family)